ncbi:ubiquinol-cytochrome-c reductase complex assembly factor 1 [Fopius arisanus]|uniref:Ubiquinol-cytochrome-c reductase complex assembly factor 1 n=1 Tax=Fopius arisanus TaxID=64838 RepID=A0A9R1TZH1_9HYME|nr:PREDICTED: ubiquinol-cytochrome-c reductase complex assembly factor 1 [Fopius arisanus]
MSWMHRLSSVRVVVRSLGARPELAVNVGSLSRCQIPSSGLSSRHFKEISTTPTVFSTAAIENEQGVVSRNWEKLKFFLIKKYKLRPLAWCVYRDAMDEIDYLGFLKEFRMADTFFSWFLVTELHVWMLMVKVMNDGIRGQESRKYIVEAMWEDANVRKKQLGNVKETVVKDHMKQLGYQFNAAIIGYDEGLLGSDKVLAGAIWRRFLQSECNDPEIVEKLVIYVRKTMIMLDKIPFEQLISKRNIKWVNYKNLLQNQL